MHPYLVFILCAAAIAAIYALLILWNNYKYNKTIRKKIRRLYGIIPEREYEPGEVEKFSGYFQRKSEDGFTIDDITWNDLDMERVFIRINQTVSSPGEEILYDMLRTPLFSESDIQKREALIRFFSEHENERETLQLLLSQVGKTRHGSLSGTILSLEDAPRVSTRIHWIMLTFLLASLVLIPFYPLQGFALFLVMAMVNISLYYAGKDRKLIEIYLDCFASLLRMLATADRMADIQWPETAEQIESIREARKSFGSLRKRAVFLTSKNEGSGDPLQLFLDYIRMVFHIDIFFYNSILKEVQTKAPIIMRLVENMGILDAAVSVASFRETLPLFCRPEFVPYTGGSAFMETEDLYHPLIAEAVANSVRLEGGTLVTGSNASGKSTFLKNLAINAILAQTVVTCTCSAYRAPFLKVMTSMALRDNLYGGDSYFIVEIKSLKRILDESIKKEPLLCIIDEVLRGTNTIERIAASSRILGELSRPWVLPVAATHDIELSYILERLYHNYHFEEEIREHQVVFNYLLQRGRATTRNAIRLLDMLGYDENIVSGARDAAESFERTGVWKPV